MSGLATFDTELVDRARGGDARALERLIALCRPDLERYARRHCESDDIDEAIQDALWILARKLGSLRSVAAFAGWLFIVVRRACRALARGRRRHVPIDAVPGAALIDSGASDAELRALIVDALSRLPQPYREVIVLKDLNGLSAGETAARLAIGEEAAKSRLHRARALLRAALAETPVAARCSRRTRP